MSGVDLPASEGTLARSIRKGAGDAIARHVQSLGGSVPVELNARVERRIQPIDATLCLYRSAGVS